KRLRLSFSTMCTKICEEPVYFMPVSEMIVGNDNSRISNILVCVVKTLLWFVPYVFVLQCFKIVDIRKMLSSR
ncbi:hypothetical protein KSW85_14605, partial [Prevotella copri]|uniref:hypothetical protein n=1 Tax=Segatella copri TaxID=165179 RepID=UPI001C385218